MGRMKLTSDGTTTVLKAGTMERMDNPDVVGAAGIAIQVGGQLTIGIGSDAVLDGMDNAEIVLSLNTWEAAAFAYAILLAVAVMK